MTFHTARAAMSLTAVLLLTSACSGSGLNSPSAPSPLVSHLTVTEPAAGEHASDAADLGGPDAVSGEEQGIDGAAAWSGTASLHTAAASATGRRAQVQGRITSINADARTITVSGRAITVPEDARIRHRGTTLPFSALKTGDQVQVKGTPTDTGVRADEVNVQRQSPAPAPALAEVKGTVGDRTGTCPAITFKVEGTSVATDRSTSFKGAKCRDLENGMTVEVRGQRQDNDRLAASVVTIVKTKDRK